MCSSSSHDLLYFALHPEAGGRALGRGAPYELRGVAEQTNRAAFVKDFEKLRPLGPPDCFCARPVDVQSD